MFEQLRTYKIQLGVWRAGTNQGKRHFEDSRPLLDVLLITEPLAHGLGL